MKTIEDLASPEELHRLEGLRRLIIEWVQSHTQFDHKPPMPKILRGRFVDNWSVLLAVADSFGNDHWSKVARDAAVAFADGYHDEAAPVALLYDIRTIFNQLNSDRIKSAALAEKLNEMEDGHGIWNAWCGENDDQYPHAITQGEIAALLRRFDRLKLRPKSLNELGPHETRGKSGRGYFREQFKSWWARYCPEKDDGDAKADILQFPPKSKPKSK